MCLGWLSDPNTSWIVLKMMLDVGPMLHREGPCGSHILKKHIRKGRDFRTETVRTACCHCGHYSSKVHVRGNWHSRETLHKDGVPGQDGKPQQLSNFLKKSHCRRLVQLVLQLPVSLVSANWSRTLGKLDVGLLAKYKH